MGDVSIDVKKIEKYNKLLERKGKNFKLAASEVIIVSKETCTVIYRTPYLPTKRIGIAQEEDIEKVLEGIQENIVFYTRDKRYGAVELMFANEKATLVHASTTDMEEWALLSTYLRKKTAGLRIGKILPEIEEV